MNIVTARFCNHGSPQFHLADEVYLYLLKNLEHHLTKASVTS